ncbi:recombination regulator RecX [[Haemophilus] ducreyi]|uniref:recombination regulator RecX n=1 Tax=Haemophilus ducreyi TaxID=730 RepID=UPI000655F071|nr:recombination regulator RecX [[Haemophilus] ducreyi]AKO46083.1 recombinase RecX [[Haemophilus] ducreyi]AKO47424.1 recombinase RecX [[Haemophilus] ducreyi]AKO48807.1 recombinase RecX [[Haemophilus] ducreyi]AKO50173.1 recombinase RecX [[Haemophilus] ducreyi]ANF62621.1 recombination regulator RecX [[Haemophilus] ducreyi]
MPKYTAVNYLIYLLSKRDYSEYDLRNKLIQKQYETDEIEHAIQQAQLNNWQNDERYCVSFIRYRSQQGIGPRRLKQELRLKGIKDYLISEQLQNTEIDWFSLAEQLFEKKRPLDWNIKVKQKMWRFMLSRGFYNEHFSHLMDLEEVSKEYE